MRKYYRLLAKGRLREMGVGNVNQKFGAGIPHSYERRLQRKGALYGRVLLRRWALIAPPAPPTWRRMLWGDLAKLYENGKRRQRIMRTK